MSKKVYCQFCQQDTERSFEDAQTPQGYPQKIRICSGCGVRELMNDPEADFVKAGGELPEQPTPEE